MIKLTLKYKDKENDDENSFYLASSFGSRSDFLVLCWDFDYFGSNCVRGVRI